MGTFPTLFIEYSRGLCHESFLTTGSNVLLQLRNQRQVLAPESPFFIALRKISRRIWYREHPPLPCLVLAAGDRSMEGALVVSTGILLHLQEIN